MIQNSDMKKLMVILEQFDPTTVQDVVERMISPASISDDVNRLISFTPELGAVYTLAAKCENKLYRFGIVRGFGGTKAQADRNMELQGENRDKALAKTSCPSRTCENGQCGFDSGIIKLGCEEYDLKTKNGRKLKVWGCNGVHASGCFCAI